MDFKEIKNTKHYLYDSVEEFRIAKGNVAVRHSWRHGDEGEWVYTDDNFVCQILKKSKIKKGETSVTCVRTVCGTFITSDRKKEMLGENGIAENIYTFSGKNLSKEDFNKRGRNSRELMFARFVADSITRRDGLSVTDAYKKAFPEANNPKYIKKRTEKLLKTETISKMIDKQIREILDEEGVTNNWLIERYKTIADLAESDTAKLRSLDSLAKISGLFDLNEKKSEQVTVWAGFSPEQLKEVEKNGKPELIAHAEKDSSD